ncbi:unnamed protein product [Gordionus sp. m RMFG-2023]
MKMPLSQMNDNESSSQIINDSLNDKEIAQANDSPISNINDSDSSEEYIIHNQNQDDLQHDDEDEINDDLENLINDLRKSFGLICVQKSCTIGDFFKLWLECKLDLEEINNEFSNDLIKCLDNRQKYLFDNNVFRSGIYVDPRFNYQNGIYPSEYDKLQARDHLMSTWRQIQIFNKPKDNQSLIGSPYWQSKKYQDPELYTLSRVVLAAPCSQVSVERSFSALGLIVTPLRTRLDKSTLNDILLIKLNKNLLNNVIF